MTKEEAIDIRRKMAEYLLKFDTSKLNSKDEIYFEVDYRGYYVFAGKNIIGLREWALCKVNPLVMAKDAELYLGDTSSCLYDSITERLVDDWNVIKAKLNEVYNKCLKRANFVA